MLVKGVSGLEREIPSVKIEGRRERGPMGMCGAIISPGVFVVAPRKGSAEVPYVCSGQREAVKKSGSPSRPITPAKRT